MALASALVQVIISAVRKTARPMLRDFGEVAQLQGSRKGPGDFVTAADLKAEDTLYELLMKARPGYGFLGEERGLIEGTDKSHTWIVDPIDGTSNFIHGFPHYAICIALEVDRKIEHALIYNPVTNDLFTASRGSGAFLNNRRIRVSNRVRLNDALLSSAIPSRELKANPKLIDLQTKLRFDAAGLRYTGSAALDLAYVAAGYLDGFIGVGLKVWDLAAGVLLVKEAGGLITDLAGEGEFMDGNIIAATPKILPVLIQEVAQATA